MKADFTFVIEAIKQLQQECRVKDERIKELMRALNNAYEWAELTGVQSLEIFKEAQQLLNK